MLKNIFRQVCFLPDMPILISVTFFSFRNRCPVFGTAAQISESLRRIRNGHLRFGEAVHISEWIFGLSGRIFFFSDRLKKFRKGYFAFLGRNMGHANLYLNHVGAPELFLGAPESFVGPRELFVGPRKLFIRRKYVLF